MVNDPRDARAYQIGIAFLGLAVVAAIVGVAWVAVEHQCDQCVKNIPNGLWIGAGAIIGIFVGALIHLPVPGAVSSSQSDAREAASATASRALVLIVLAAVCGALVVAEAGGASSAWSGLGAAIGGVLLGLPIPSPGRRG